MTTTQDARRKDAGAFITITFTPDQMLLRGPEYRRKIDAFLSEKA